MQYQELYELCARQRADAFARANWHEGLILQKGPGHTMEAAKFETLHGVVGAANQYADMLASRGLDDSVGLPIVQAIAACQVTGQNPRTDGNFRWYREETRVNDTNAAFFILGPMIKLLAVAPERVTDAQKTVMLSMMNKACNWFENYARSATMYYSNPAVSNMACLYAIAVMTEDAAATGRAKEALDRYFAYTANRGWGWGESTSPSYLMEILPPLKLIEIIARRAGHTDIAEQSKSFRTELLDWVGFHGEMEFVPGIRNYNTAGNPRNGSMTKLLAGVTDDPSQFGMSLFNLMLFREEIEDFAARHAALEEKSDETFRRMRIFDSAFATAWRGKHIHLGTINEYPYIPGEFQNPGWGVGWQAMPVAFVVEGEQLGYLRWTVQSGERRRCFPNEKRRMPNEENAALFTEQTFPDMVTVSAQKDNVALVLRRTFQIHNSACDITDEIVVPRYAEVPKTYDVNGVSWTALVWENKATLLIGALKGYTLHPKADGGYARDNSLVPQKLVCDSCTRADWPAVTVSQPHWRGEETRIDARGTETAWVLIALDYALDNVEDYLKNVEITQNFRVDLEIPRSFDTMIHEFTVKTDTAEVSLRYDPTEQKYRM